MRKLRRDAAGFINYSRSYLTAASYIDEGVKTKKVELRFDAPVFALLAHSLELSLKGALILAGVPHGKVEVFGHKLLELYDAVLSNSKQAGLISEAENACRSNWKSLLRKARDEHQAKMIAVFGKEVGNTPELGVFDNQTIGRELPELRDQVKWLNERHTHRGSLFRYHETRIDQYLEINAFGLRENVPFRTVFWGCDAIIKNLEDQVRPGKK